MLADPKDGAPELASVNREPQRTQEGEIVNTVIDQASRTPAPRGTEDVPEASDTDLISVLQLLRAQHRQLKTIATQVTRCSDRISVLEATPG